MRYTIASSFIQKTINKQELTYVYLIARLVRLLVNCLQIHYKLFDCRLLDTQKSVLMKKREVGVWRGDLADFITIAGRSQYRKTILLNS